MIVHHWHGVDFRVEFDCGGGPGMLGTVVGHVEVDQVRDLEEWRAYAGVSPDEWLMEGDTDEFCDDAVAEHADDGPNDYDPSDYRPCGYD